MDNKKEIFVSIDLVEDVYTDDIPSSFKESFGYKYVEGYEFYEIPRSFGRAEGEPIEINKAIQIIQDLKVKGSTHVQIEYHPDHQEYIFSGMKAELATDELISKYKKYWEEYKKLEDLVKVKEEEIKEIRKQIKNL